MKRWDVIVIGGGPAGRAAALAAVSPKRRVLLIDSAGTTGWQNILPGFMQAFAIAAHNHNSFSEVLAEARAYRDQFIATQPLKRTLQAAQVAVLAGQAEFIDAKTIKVDRDHYMAKKFIIASGRAQKSDKILWSPQIILELKTRPARVILVDPDELLLQFAKALVTLGTKVATIESQHISSIQKLQRSVRLNIHQNDKLTHATAELVIGYGAGEANLSCHPEKASVKLIDDGIMIDRWQRTSNRQIYAAGECLAPDQSHQTPTEQGHLAGTRATKRFT